ncbi:PREDICTED: uncharacterized protein LOC105621720, partial [Atta cephalotes]|uniref:Odorant receptor n=1 Tax=Atta cephalotes TaxID=12957 RepID=A0A158NM10_ATTCE
PVKVINFTKISVALTCVWPPPPNATKFDIISFKILWYMCYLSNILLLLPLLSSIYEYLDDPVILAKSVCLCCAVLQVTIKMMVCYIRQNCFQHWLIGEIDEVDLAPSILQLTAPSPTVILYIAIAK